MISVLYHILQKAMSADSNSRELVSSSPTLHLFLSCSSNLTLSMSLSLSRCISNNCFLMSVIISALSSPELYLSLLPCDVLDDASVREVSVAVLEDVERKYL